MVDASQGVEAQTLANAYLTVDNALEVIPVINKIDLPSAQPDECKRRIEDIIGLDAWTPILASAKDRTGVRDILEAIVERSRCSTDSHLVVQEPHTVLPGQVVHGHSNREHRQGELPLRGERVEDGGERDAAGDEQQDEQGPKETE